MQTIIVKCLNIVNTNSRFLIIIPMKLLKHYTTYYSLGRCFLVPSPRIRWHTTAPEFRRDRAILSPSPQFCISLFADIRVLALAACSSDGRSGRRGQGVCRRIRRRRRPGRSRPPFRHGQGIYSFSLVFVLVFLFSVLRKLCLDSWLVLFQPCQRY